MSKELNESFTVCNNNMLNSEFFFNKNNNKIIK